MTLQFSRDEEDIIYAADPGEGEQVFAIGIEEVVDLACYAWGVSRRNLIVWLQLQFLLEEDGPYNRQEDGNNSLDEYNHRYNK